MAKAWIIGGGLTPSFLGLTEKTAQLMAERGHTVSAIVVSPDCGRREAGLLKAVGADEVFSLPLDTSDINSEAAAVEALAGIYNTERPEFIVFESSVFFTSVAPAFAAKIDCGITADCTELAWDSDGRLVQIRPAFGGRKLASNINVDGTAIATVRKGVFQRKMPEYAEEAEIKTVPLQSSNDLWTLTERIAEELDSQELCEARVILSGGLGMGSRENYRRLYELAALTGAAVGASRAAVAAGFAGYDHQVGQTGVSVRPELYVAFGISGAVQHLSGITGAKRIIAINTDTGAPIHRCSDLSIIADCNAVLDALIEKFRKDKDG